MVANTSRYEITADYVNNAVIAILRILGEPRTNAQKEALEAFQESDANTIKRLSVLNLQDNYIKCLGYLVSAPKLTPQTDTILAESCRAAADHVRDVVLTTLGTELGNA